MLCVGRMADPLAPVEQSAGVAPAPSPPSSFVDPSSSAGSVAPETIGLSDYARSLNHDISGLGSSDEEIFRNLLQILRSYPQLQHLARYGSELLPHYDNWQKFLQQQAGQPAAVAATPVAPSGSWAPPAKYDEVERLTRQWYTVDQQGQMVPRPEAPHSVIQKVNDYQQYINDWQKKLIHDPQAALGKMVEERAQEVLQKAMASRQVQDSATQVIQRHSNWLFYKDPATGMPVYGQYTPEGVRFWDHVQRIERMGVKDPYEQEYLALTALDRERLQAEMMRYRQAQPQQVPQQYAGPAAPQYAAPAQRQPSYVPQRQALPADGGDLEQMIMQNLAAAGIR